MGTYLVQQRHDKLWLCSMPYETFNTGPRTGAPHPPPQRGHVSITQACTPGRVTYIRLRTHAVPDAHVRPDRHVLDFLGKGSIRSRPVQDALVIQLPEILLPGGNVFTKRHLVRGRLQPCRGAYPIQLSSACCDRHDCQTPKTSTCQHMQFMCDAAGNTAFSRTDDGIDPPHSVQGLKLDDGGCSSRGEPRQGPENLSVLGGVFLEVL